MASEKLQVILELVTGQYKREAREAATATGRIADSAGTAGRGIGQLQTSFGLLKGAVAALGISRIVGEMGEMARAAEEDARSQEVLATALRTNVRATDDQISSTELWISSMQRATNVADTELRQAVTNLTVSGRTLEEAQADIAIAMDIAASKGLSLDSVVKGLVRSLGSGSTAGLARLGIATRDAAGEMLSYEEVLKNAQSTMGGTAGRAALLTGALEQQQIQMAELREEAGSKLKPAFSRLGDVFNEFLTFLSGGDQSLAFLTGQINVLVNQGIDPFANKAATLTDLLIKLGVNGFEPTIANLGFLQTALQTTPDDLTAAADALGDFGVEMGLSADEVAELQRQLRIDAVTPFHNALDAGRHRRKQYTSDVEDMTSATLGLTDAQLAAVSPTFALASAANAVADAHDAYIAAVAESGAASEEAERAALNLGEAELRLDAAFTIASDNGLAMGVDALRDILEQAGVLPGIIDQITNSILTLNATPITSKVFATAVQKEAFEDNLIGGKAAGGPISANTPYLVGERGPEIIWPSQGGTVMTNVDMMKALSGKGSININVASPSNNLPQDLQYAALLANLATLT